MQAIWRNTRTVLNDVDSAPEEVCERSALDALSLLGISQFQEEMTTAQFAEQVLVLLLDEKFMRYLHECESSVASNFVLNDYDGEFRASIIP